MVDFMKEIKKNSNLTDEEAAQLAAAKIADSKPKSRMYYKIGASREMAGGKKVDPKANMSDKLKSMCEAIEKGESITDEKVDTEPDKTTIEFSTSAIAVMEDVGTFKVYVTR